MQTHWEPGVRFLLEDILYMTAVTKALVQTDFPGVQFGVY